MKDASPSRGITMVFLNELETNLTKMIVVNDLLANWNLISPWISKREIGPRWRWSTTFWWQVKASTRTFLFYSFKQVIEIPLRGRGFIINHGHVSWKLHDLLGNCFFPLPLCNRLLLAYLNIQIPRACEFLLEVEIMAFFQCSFRWRGTIRRHSMY
jgi:hypothetical protein